MKVFLDALSRGPSASIGTIAYTISDMQIIEKRYPSCEFFLLSADPSLDNLYLSKLPYKVRVIKRSKTELGTIFQIRKILSQVDAVVSAWGDAYITLPPYYLYRKVLFLKKKNIPLILFPSSIGPFTRGIKNFFAVRGLKKFDVITVRDRITYDSLKQYKIRQLKLIHDAAFVLNPSKEDEIKQIIAKTGLKSDEFIGLNISVLLYHKFKEINIDYISTMVDLIKWLKKSYKMPILLVPHQIFPDIYNYSLDQYKSIKGDDRYPIDLILNQMKDKEDVFCISDYYTPFELKGVIGKSKIFIGGRMHSVIASISQNIPSVIIEYSHKASGMMKMLDMEEYVWSMSESYESLKEKITKLWEEKENVISDLSSLMPKIFEEIYNLANYIERS